MVKRYLCESVLRSGVAFAKEDGVCKWNPKKRVLLTYCFNFCFQFKRTTSKWWWKEALFWHLRDVLLVPADAIWECFAGMLEKITRKLNFDKGKGRGGGVLCPPLSKPLSLPRYKYKFSSFFCLPFPVILDLRIWGWTENKPLRRFIFLSSPVYLKM